MSTNGTTQSPSIAIIGGGIAGLLTLLSIAQHAPHLLPALTLYEAAHQFGEIGAGVAFGPNAVRAMKKISLRVAEGFDRVDTSNRNPAKERTWFDFWYGMAGPDEGMYICERRLTDNEWSERGGMVHRASFLEEMVRLVPAEVRVEFDKKMVGLWQQSPDGPVVIQFADGTEARHDAVIGCDGIKSQTRVEMLGPDDPAAHAVFTGKYCYRGLIPMEQAVEALGEQLAQNSQMYLGHGGHVLTFPVKAGAVMNVVAFSSAETWDDREWVVHANRQKMYQDFEGWGANVQKIMRLMQKPDIWALFNHLPAKSYCDGRVCLLGDGAHASSPHQGGGAGQAVEDAYVMGVILKEVRTAKDLDTAFAAFDRVRRPRTQKLVATSRECGMLYDLELPGHGDDLEKVAHNIQHRLEWIWDKDIDEDVEEARRWLLSQRNGI